MVNENMISHIGKLCVCKCKKIFVMHFFCLGPGSKALWL